MRKYYYNIIKVSPLNYLENILPVVHLYSIACEQAEIIKQL